MKKQVLSMLVLLAAVATGAMAQNYTITLPTVSNGSVVAEVNKSSVTSAAAGATVSLVATPDAGYRLKSISGVYETSASKTETLNATAATVNGTKFQAVATARNLYGWRVYNPGSANTLTISSKDGTTIKKIELTSTWGNSRRNNMLSVTAGTLSFDGSDPSTTVTINDVNSTSVTISGSGTVAAATWCISSAKIYYEGMIETAVEISDTENANVKIFTMPSGNVTVSTEFESAVVAVNSITLSQTEAAMTVGGETLTLTPTVLPAEATDKSVTWSSSNEAVATVTDGVVTAVAAGTATITVTTTDGAKTATCAVTVAAPAASTYTVTVKEGTEDATSWTIAPAEATTTGVAQGTEVTATYSGTKKVKSVKAVKKAAAAAYTMAANATAGDVGKLICTDGHIHTYNADAACTKSRVAMIAYVGSETGVAGYTHGLALALTDESSSGMYWNDAKTACTNKNTSATVESASWMLPSKDQWTNMIDACKNVLGTNNDSQDLRDGFISVGGSNLESQDYWSSTEYVYSNEAWMFNFGYDSWYDYPKDESAYPLVRACLAF